MESKLELSLNPKSNNVTKSDQEQPLLSEMRTETEKFEQENLSLGRASLSILGALILTFSNCVPALWGPISLYTTSYFRQSDPNLTIVSATIVFPIQHFTSLLSRPLAGILVIKLGFKPLATIAITLLVASFVVCSQLHSYWAFIPVYGVIGGLIFGIMGVIPFWSAWEALPHRKGLATGITDCGFGTGLLIFTVVSQFLANPEDKTPDIQGALSEEKYYDSSVTKNVPRMFYGLAAVIAVMSYAAIILIKSPSLKKSDVKTTSEHSQEASRHQEMSLGRVARDSQFWTLNFILALSALVPFFVVGNYKFYGFTRPALSNDFYLTLVGSVGSFADLATKPFFGLILDKLPVKTVYLWVLFTQLTLSATVDMISFSRPLFIIWISCLFILQGTHWVLAPMTCTKNYGNEVGIAAFGISSGFMSLGNFAGFLVINYFLESQGFATLLYCFSSLNAIAMVICVFGFKGAREQKK